MNNNDISKAMTIKLDKIVKTLPPKISFQEGIRRAPKRNLFLSKSETILALKNALRYLPEKWHQEMAPEFLEELQTCGRIYAYRFRPPGVIKGNPLETYTGNCLEGQAFQVMIDNNLDFEVALYPYELVTYGETGQVCQNWMQYLLIKAYLQALTKDQTLVVESGHPLGLFRSNPGAPRVIITNGLMVGCFDDQDNWDRAAALGVANYGPTSAGGWIHIGPQGIVHGTYSTILNAARLKLSLFKDGDLTGHLFVSSGLGSMSGAQGKAAEIAKAVAIIAEVDPSRIKTRLAQGWISRVVDSPAEAFSAAMTYKKEKIAASIAFFGNIVDLLEYAVTSDIKIDLLTDQTSCHAVYDGGYCPQGLTFDQRTEFLKTERTRFKELVDQSLKKHIGLIKTLVERGGYFFDYGNSFLKAVYDTGITEICTNGRDSLDGFIYPSYVEDIVGPILFDLGYGPLRWVCLSGNPKDLLQTDMAALSCIDPARSFQDRDNYAWIKDAAANNLVVGTQARILYHDAEGRMKIALKFNEMVRNKTIGPVMLGRDHHDTGGADSPFRETANIKDGSNIMAEMATQSFAGNAARGMSLISIHNGGGVGIGKAINCGFGLVLDGSPRVDEIIRQAISWDVMGGVARRAWARNEKSIETVMQHNLANKGSEHITLPYLAEEEMLRKLVDKVF
jgi:urocanate hydratase